MKLKFTDHIELSEGDTRLVSTSLCPLTEADIKENQLFEDGEGDKVVMCQIQGQRLQDGTFNGFTCPHYYGAVYPSKTACIVNCRNPKHILNKDK